MDARHARHALHAQRDRATYLVEQRGAHYLFTIKGNQKKLARQLHNLPWKDIPVVHRDDTTGHGRSERRLVQVATVNNLLFPNARQVLRIQRKRRAAGQKRWRTETAYAINDLPAEQATAAEIASWARGHWTVEVRHEALCFRTGVKDPRRLAVAAAG